MATERHKVDNASSKAVAEMGAVAEIERLRGKYNELSTKKTRAETHLENARNQLEKFKKEARELYGTDDLPTLQARLLEIKAENEAKTAAYREDLEKIEANLRAVENKYKGASENPL